MKKLPISVCIIAKNEEKYIQQCLERIKPLGFEIVVIDTGSEDNTKEIAKKYTDKVLDFAWIDDFAAARNFAAQQASNDWILSLDCDEYIDQADTETLESFLVSKNKERVGALRLQSLMYNDKGGMTKVLDDIHRFYNRRYFHFVGRIHEQLFHKYKKGFVVSRFILPIKATHYGYAIQGEEMVKKQERNLKLIAKELEQDKENPYLYFQSGQSYKAIDQYDLAIENFEKALSLKPGTNMVYVETLICSLATMYALNGRMAEAAVLMEQYEPVYQTAKFTYLYASVLFDSKEYVRALVHYIKATILPDVGKLGTDLVKCYNYIIRIYKEFGDEDSAKMYYDKYRQSIEKWGQPEGILSLDSL